MTKTKKITKAVINLNEITKEKILSIDFESTVDNVTEYKEYYEQMPGENHYRLLAYISSILPSGSLVYDIGTKWGTSAYALSYNKNVKVISYDISNPTVGLKTIPVNIEFKVGDFRTDENILDADVILIDVDPHDGITEKNFYDWFIESNYTGLTLWDDTQHPSAMLGMKTEFLDKIDKEVIHLTSVGHITGTTAILF